MMKSKRRALTVAGALFALAVAVPAVAATSASPIRIGSTLALTGGLAATGVVHKLVGEIYVEELNKRGGLLGRKVEWIVKDDQSRPDVARTLYEQIITVDKVDLLMGPYATPSIISAMGVAQRYNKILIHHTFGVPSLAKYEMHFPAWHIGSNPESTAPATVLDAVAASGSPLRTIALVTSKFPSVHFVSVGAREVAKKRGIKEVLWLEWEFGNKDFGPIASRIKDARPDFVFVGDIGVEGLQLLDAMSKIDYKPPLTYHLYPAPGPMLKAPYANGALAATIFEQHPPFTTNAVAGPFVKIFNARASKAGLPDNSVDTQAAASYSAWQILEAAVTATKSLDDKAMAQWLKANQVDTIQGRLRFNGPNNFGDDLLRVKQVQKGQWVTVWPKQWAAPGAKLITR